MSVLANPFGTSCSSRNPCGSIRPGQHTREPRRSRGPFSRTAKGSHSWKVGLNAVVTLQRLSELIHFPGKDCKAECAGIRLSSKSIRAWRREGVMPTVPTLRSKPVLQFGRELGIVHAVQHLLAILQRIILANGSLNCPSLTQFYLSAIRKIMSRCAGQTEVRFILALAAAEYTTGLPPMRFGIDLMNKVPMSCACLRLSGRAQFPTGRGYVTV